jgi:SAM-dependent methyltransferase
MPREEMLQPGNRAVEEGPFDEARSFDEAGALREYWDADAPTYDLWPEHGAWTAAERAAWAGTLQRSMGRRGMRVLDVGAGTGFLSLAAARLGCQVTALDVSPGMLERLKEAAVQESLQIETVCAPADHPPPGPFDVVMERLVLWTLPDPGRALAAWRESAPEGRLLAFEVKTGRDYVEGVKRRARRLLSRVRRVPAEHHAAYPQELRARLPIRREPWPSGLIMRIEDAGWHAPDLSRLRDVEWARRLAVPPFERLFGATPEYLITAWSQMAAGPGPRPS